MAEQYELDLKDYPIVDVEHSHEAAERAVDLGRNGTVEALMKGSLHTDELIRAVLHKEKGIRSNVASVTSSPSTYRPTPALAGD